MKSSETLYGWIIVGCLAAIIYTLTGLHSQLEALNKAHDGKGRITRVPTPQGECWVNTKGGMHCWMYSRPDQRPRL